MSVCTLMSKLLSLQSPARALKVEAGKENPNLTDNWDDAEGYYSKITLCCIKNYSKHVCIICKTCGPSGKAFEIQEMIFEMHML